MNPSVRDMDFKFAMMLLSAANATSNQSRRRSVGGTSWGHQRPGNSAMAARSTARGGVREGSKTVLAGVQPQKVQ